MPGMIKKEDIEKVRATADLYDIVSATVTLKPSGNRHIRRPMPLP